MEQAVKTAIGSFNITTNHIMGKTMDNGVDIEGKLNYVELPEGTNFELFEKEVGDDGRLYDTGNHKFVEVGKDLGYDNKIVSAGPSWQIRNDGAGHLAKGNIRWDKTGKVEFGSGVTLSWGSITNAPEINGGLSKDEVNGLIETQISAYKIKSENIEGTHLSGATVSSPEKQDGKYSWILNEDGTGYLADEAIEWTNDNGKTKLNINGSVNINGTAIMRGIESDNVAKGKFEDLVADKINATTINTTELNTILLNKSFSLIPNSLYLQVSTGNKGEMFYDAPITDGSSF
jgi:hypothetical protein